MIYKVKAKYRSEKLGEFVKKLTDGSISRQQPDGEEIVSAMQEARVTSPGVIEWFETCFCSTPLKHERDTVYDHFLSEIETEEVDELGEIEGTSFWAHLLAQTAGGH